MRRTLGIISALAGWLCIPLSAVSAVVASRFGGLSPEQNGLTPDSVYGIPADLVLWIVVGAALLAAIPVVLATVAENSWLPLFAAAAVLIFSGVALLPDALGRAYSLAMLPGAALFGLAGWLFGSAQPALKAAAPNPDVGIWSRVAAPATLPVVPTAAVPDQPELAITPEPAAAPEAAVTPAQFEPANTPAQFEPAITAADAAAPEAAVTAAAAATAVQTDPAVTLESEPVEPADVPPSPPAPSSAGAPPIHDGELAPDEVECTWCSARNPAGASECANCGAPLDERTFPADEPIPGVTAVAPEYRAYQTRAASKKKRPSILSTLLDNPERRLPADVLPTPPGALTPPSREVRAQMDRIAIEIASGAASADPAWTPSLSAGEESAPQDADAAPGPPAELSSEGERGASD